jgi:hypothetical protein
MVNYQNAFVYDLEIKKGILGRGEERIDGVEYCGGWTDHAGMGISVLGGYCCRENLPLVFCDDNRELLAKNHAQYDFFVSFNGVNFDNKVIKAAWDLTIPDRLCYDILRELWIADGLDPDKFSPRTHGGYGLDACAMANFGIGKSGNGALAPVQWQRGEIGAVISYCLRDVMLTRRLYMNIITNEGFIKHPKTGLPVRLAMPGARVPQQAALIEVPAQMGVGYLEGE